MSNKQDDRRHALGLDDLDRLVGGRFGRFDVACPLCGPGRQDPANRSRKVMRVWWYEPNFATFHCARCGESGYAGAATARHGTNRDLVAHVHAEVAKRDRQHALEQHDKALWLWRQRQAIAGTI